MRLILLRHGETVWNIDKRLQGHDNSPLSERGIEQAKAIAGSIRTLAPARVVASDLGRARETASLIGYGGAPTDERLRELNMGEWTGERKSDLMANKPQLYSDWRAGRFTPAGGESWDDFVLRIKTGLTDCVYKAKGDLLAVVHSGVVRAACFSFLGLSPAQLLPVTPGTLTILEFDDAQSSSPPRLEAYNLGAFVPDSEAAD